jgi:hypothetical protein
MDLKREHNMAEFDASNPEELNAAAAAALASAGGSKPSFPEPPAPASDLVDLPCGLVRTDDVVRTAKVRELTGADEEELAKASQADNPFHFLTVLLECGVTKLGDEDPAKTKELLKQLTIGDRDQLVVGVRKATYGSQVDIPVWQCPACGDVSEIGFDLDEDVEVKKLDDPRSEIEFDVPLRRDRKARVRIANGADQIAMYDPQHLTLPERNTILLGRCVQNITDANGQVSMVLSPLQVRSLGMADRQAILRELTDRQPGPALGDIKLVHTQCGKEVSLGVSVGDLFRA